MTEYELLKSTKSLLLTLNANEIDPKDVRYLELYEEYKRLKEEKHKIGYIAYYLSEEHGCSLATFYRVIKRMEQIVV